MRRRDESLLGRPGARDRGFHLESKELAVGGCLKGKSLDRATGQRKYGLGARFFCSMEGLGLEMPHGEGTRPCFGAVDRLEVIRIN